MVIWYYGLCMFGTVLCSTVFFWKWHKHFDIYFSLLYAFFPIVNTGYLLYAIAPDLGGALTANRITYLGGCYLELILFLSICSLCHIRIRKWVTFILLIISTILYGGALSVGYTDIFYKNVIYKMENGFVVLVKEYGWLHTCFYVVVIAYFLGSIVALAYGAFKKPDASIKNICLLVLTNAVSIFSFFFGRAITNKVEFVPMAYVVDAIVYLIIVDRLCLYDIDESAMDMMAANGRDGFVSFDFSMNYLGCNEVAGKFFPKLQTTRVDMKLDEDNLLKEFLISSVEQFKQDEISKDLYYEKNDKIFKVVVNYLYDGRRKRGYQIMITDDTRHQQYLQMINNFNANLKEEVAKKTAYIRELTGTEMVTH